MRTGCLVVLCAALAGVLGGCAVLGHDPPPRTVSQPPAELALHKSLVIVAKTAKWPGMVEASPVRQAHLISPADWIVCAQSAARDLSRPYALFFNGDTMVHFRLAVQVDDCALVPYAPVAAPIEFQGPLQIRP